nr:cytochrome b6/f complex subunit VI [Epilobium palustre]
MNFFFHFNIGTLGKCFLNICIKKEYISFSPFILMLTITSFFGFLLAALTITSVLFIGLTKIRLI